jgi:hypothetical protein
MADTRRPVLYGEPEAGNAWTDYRLAFARIEADPELEPKVRPASRARLTLADRSEFADAHADILALVQRGAHRADADSGVRWSAGFGGNPPCNLLGLRALSNLAVTLALVEIEKGNDVRAVEHLLDAAQLGRDILHRPLLIDVMIGAAGMHIPLGYAVVMDDLLAKLSPRALARFAEGLAILEAGLAPVSPALRGEAVLFVRTIRHHPEQLFDAFAGADVTWRYGMSSRLLLADAGVRILDLTREAVEATQLPWVACRESASSIGIDEPNPLVATCGSNYLLLTRTWRETLARLRLLRMAIEHARGRPVPRLDDPFGGVLGYERDEQARMRFFSAGAEGERMYLHPIAR